MMMMMRMMMKTRMIRRYMGPVVGVLQQWTLWAE